MSHAAVMIPSLDRIAGAERQAMQLAKGLCHRGWRVTVVALSGEGKAARDELHAGGVEFVTLGMRKGLADLRGWIRLSRWLWRSIPTWCMRICRKPPGLRGGRARWRRCASWSTPCTPRLLARLDADWVTLSAAGGPIASPQ